MTEAMHMAPPASVRVENDGHVRIVTLNRPDSMNAFSDEMHDGLIDALRGIGRDGDARAIVLTGAGRAFSAGGDIDSFELYANDLAARRAILRVGRQLFDDLVNVHLPVVAAVNGPAVGLGCTLVSACDMVFMSEKSYLADPHVTVALVAGDGGAVTWPLNAGLLRAKEYLLTGDRVSPDVAVEIGMANKVVAADKLLNEATAFAHRLAASAVAGRAGHQGGAESARAPGIRQCPRHRLCGGKPIARHRRIPRCASAFQAEAG